MNDNILELAHQCGARKMILDISKRCSYPGAAKELVEDQRRYDAAKDRLVSAITASIDTAVRGALQTTPTVKMP